MALVTQALRMSREYDPRALIIQKLEEIGKTLGPARGWNLDDPAEGFDRLQPLLTLLGIRITGPDILLCIYDRSGQYSSGKVLVPPTYLEDKVQGKVGCVMGLGPLCKGQEYMEWFGGNPPKIGDWWVTSIREGVTYLVGDLVFKKSEWKYLHMQTHQPDLVM